MGHKASTVREKEWCQAHANLQTPKVTKAKMDMHLFKLLKKKIVLKCL